MEIVLDFDGTCVAHAFPEIGQDIGAVPVLKELVKNGHRLILFTMRSDVKNPKSEDKNIICISGDYLTQAVNWFKENDIPLYGIQKNPTQELWTSSPKAYGHLIIDDAALGAPLMNDFSISNRPFISWPAVKENLIKKGILPEEIIKHSRCCGRCDGHYDICVADQICEKHKTRGCEICFGPKTSTTKQVQEKCKHTRIEEIQGGQIERCRDCGKTWGGK